MKPEGPARWPRCVGSVRGGAACAQRGRPQRRDIINPLRLPGGDLIQQLHGQQGRDPVRAMGDSLQHVSRTAPAAAVTVNLA